MSKIDRFTKKRRNKYLLEKIDRDLRKEFEIEEIPHKRKMIQYSKVLTTAILIFTIILNAFYFVYIVPNSGSLGITDAALEYSGSILKIWDSGTIVFFCGYFAKSLFETKFEKDFDSTQSKADSLSAKVMEKVDEVLEEIN